MKFVNSVINLINSRRISSIDLYSRFPIEIQNEVLTNLINDAKDTEWGRKYNYDSIDSIEKFQENVPIQDYNDIKSYVERMKGGESDILWPGVIKWFAKSSGTTSDKSKFIPVSQEALDSCHIRGPKDIFALYLRDHPKSKVLRGKMLTLGGSHRINKQSADSLSGDLSAILLENTPFWSDFLRTPSTEIALIEEFEEKIERIIDSSLDENVTSFAGVPSWYLVLLRRVLERTGKDNLLEVWPNLEVFAHGGINFEPYREQYKKLIPSDNMHYIETYNASEGFFGIQDDPTQKGMLLMLDYGIFYEFIPMSEWDKENPTVISLEHVEPDVNYAMIISTNAGLWRYLIGDTVKFTSIKPYRIVITGRTKHFINAFGEEVIIDNAENALKVACNETGAIISEYTAGPVFMNDKDKGKHEWIIEFEKEPENIEQFRTILDKELQNLNSDYEAKRHKNTTLNKLEIVVAPKNTFYKWMKERGKVGGQNKIPRLANNRKYLDEVLKMINQ